MWAANYRGHDSTKLGYEFELLSINHCDICIHHIVTNCQRACLLLNVLAVCIQMFQLFTYVHLNICIID